MICDWSTATYLIFSENGIPLIYYSHLSSIAIFTLLIIVSFLPLKPWPKVSFRLLSAVYIFWLFGDLVLWGNDKIDNIMFFWSLVNLIEPLIFASAYIYFISFTEKRSITLREFFTMGVLFVPTFIMATTNLSVVGFDYTNCDRNVIEGIAAYYNYFIEAVFLLLMLYHSAKNIISSIKQKQIITRNLMATISLFSLLGSFLLANFLGTYFEAYSISQLGHIAVPIFAGILLFTTIRFETFEPRVILVDVCTGALIILIFSLYFVEEKVSQNYIISITLFLSIIFSYLLINGIQKEVSMRKKNEVLVKELEVANKKLVELDKQKSEFVSFATHQLKSPLAAMKGYASLILDGDYGEVAPPVHESVSRIFESAKTLANVVEDYLNISRIELGSMKYYFSNHNIKSMVEDVIAEIEPNIKKSGLKFSVDIPAGEYTTSADPDKLKQVFMNLIDNSVKYTPTGSIVVSLRRNGEKILFKVEDTGIGMSEKTISSLFEKFTRAYNANKTNIHGTGLGLYVARQIVEAHHGKVWAESDGEGKGSRFFVELDVQKV